MFDTDSYDQGVADCLFDLDAYLHDYRIRNLSTGETMDVVDPDNARYFAELGLVRGSLGANHAGKD